MPHSNREEDYDKPFGWWGNQWSAAEPRSLTWLIDQGMLSVQGAAFLSLAIEARRSLIIVAEPDQAGKTTLLTALVDFLPPSVRRIYIRGIYERFSFIGEVPAEDSYVLCNEISHHLPTYLWGRGVRHLFEALEAGYPLATTMHAASASSALEEIQRYPLEVPRQQVMLLDLIVTIGMSYVGNQLTRRISRIERISSRDGAIRIERLTEREPLRAPAEHQLGGMIRAISEWFSLTDDEASRLLVSRERFLHDLLQRRILDREFVLAEIRALQPAEPE